MPPPQSQVNPAWLHPQQPLLLCFCVLAVIKSLHRAHRLTAGSQGPNTGATTGKWPALLFVEADTQVSLWPLLGGGGGVTITGSCELSLLVEMRPQYTMHRRRAQWLQIGFKVNSLSRIAEPGPVASQTLRATLRIEWTLAVYWRFIVFWGFSKVVNERRNKMSARQWMAECWAEFTVTSQSNNVVIKQHEAV